MVTGPPFAEEEIQAPNNAVVASVTPCRSHTADVRFLKKWRGINWKGAAVWKTGRATHNPTP